MELGFRLDELARLEAVGRESGGRRQRVGRQVQHLDSMGREMPADHQVRAVGEYFPQAALEFAHLRR